VFSVLEALFNAAPAAASRQADLLKRLVPLYLAMSEPSDNVLLRIFRRCEVAGGPSLRQFVTFWNNSGLRASLSAQPVETLGTLDPAIVYRTCVFACSTPIDAARIASTESIYDPIFILAVLAGAFDSDYRISGGEWLALLQCNILGLALSSLSSPRRELRLMADRVLAKARVQLTVRIFPSRHRVFHLIRISLCLVIGKYIPRARRDRIPPRLCFLRCHGQAVV
jgi:nucleolar pre-ribosomal-associated protein 1